MSGLPAPSAELAARGLGEVGFDQRLVVYQLRRRQGPMPITVYSLSEALGAMASEFFVPDYQDIAAWIDDCLGDHDLASAISQTDADDREEDNKRVEIVQLIARRIGQYREVLPE